MLTVTDSSGNTYIARIDGKWVSTDAQGNKIEVRINHDQEQRYRVQGDGSGHKYFVEVGNEGEFERWLSTFDGGLDWNEYVQDGGYDYEKNRIDGRFTFTDPRNE